MSRLDQRSAWRDQLEVREEDEVPHQVIGRPHNFPSVLIDGALSLLPQTLSLTGTPCVAMEGQTRLRLKAVHLFSKINL